MTSALRPGADPFSAAGGPHGALVLHGLTSHPASVRGLAEAFAGAGFAVECPRLPGHGTLVEEMVPTRFTDWAEAAEAVYTDLAGRVDKVVVAGLSMGGALTAWLASRHREIAGIVCINPIVEPSPPVQELLRAAVDDGQEFVDSIGSDVAAPGVVEDTYDRVPLRALLSLFDAIAEFQPGLANIECPVLLITSAQDHVVIPSNSDHFAATVRGPVERVVLERSYHVATLDLEHHDVEARAVEFAAKVTTG